MGIAPLQIHREPLPDDADPFPIETPKVPVSPIHARSVDQLRISLRDHCTYQLWSECEVTGDVNFYYNPDNRRDCAAPDVMLFKHPLPVPFNRSLRTWMDDPPPALIVEVISRSTWQKDTGLNLSVYARMGVREYWIYDPAERRQDKRQLLEGHVLTPAGLYENIVPGQGTVEGRSVPLYPSQVLQTHWGLDHELRMRLKYADRPAWYPLAGEAVLLAAAEAQRADTETRRADTETRRADAEAQRAAEAERELARLRKRLGLDAQDGNTDTSLTL